MGLCSSISRNWGIDIYGGSTSMPFNKDKNEILVHITLMVSCRSQNKGVVTSLSHLLHDVITIFQINEEMKSIIYNLQIQVRVEK